MKWIISSILKGSRFVRVRTDSYHRKWFWCFLHVINDRPLRWSVKSDNLLL